jgi:DNA-binding NtrC family response regulator
LRAHVEDVPALVNFYIDIFNREFKKHVHGASAAAMRSLGAYAWPGNIRELRNAVERAMLLAEGEYLEPADFPIATAATASGQHRFELPAGGIDLEEVERSLVTQALQRTGGNQSRAATLLGMHRDQIRYRMEKFGLSQKSAAGHS